MKKLIFLLALAVVAIAASAQSPYVTVTASEADTNKNAETDYLVIPNTGSFLSPQILTIQVKCVDQFEGTSDGTLTIEGSVDGISYFNLTEEEFTDMNNDTVTIAPDVVATWVIPKTYFSKYRIKAVGTSGDTTLFVTKYKVQPYK
jgi:hypothetical protein